MLNKVILIGRLTNDPELRKTQTGVSVTSFSVAVNRSYAKDQTDFIDVVAWRNTADFVSKYFAKGRMIVIEGNLQTRLYEDKTGSKRKITEVIAENVDFGEPKREPMKPEELITINQAPEIMDSDDLPF